MQTLNTPQEIFDAVAGPLHQASYVSAILIAEESYLRLLWVYDPQKSTPDDPQTLPALPEIFPVNPAEISPRLASPDPLVINTGDPISGIPETLYKGLRVMGCSHAAFIPIHAQGRLSALIVLGSRTSGSFSPAALRLHASLGEMASTALEKVNALDGMHKRLAALQTLDSVSRAVSLETNLNDLFRVTHEQIVHVIGEINFLIALYDSNTDTIEIPYAYEDNEFLKLPVIPLGQGLTSILIRTRQPLLLVEDTERRAMELGAKVVGSPAKSWLGVPLLVGGQAIGAIIVQDTEREHRFDDEDVRLLSNVAAQVAVSVRNARLLEETRRQAEREHIVSAVTARLWASADTETILRTAVRELGVSLKASKSTIRLDVSQAANAAQTPTQPEQPAEKP